MVAAPVPSGPKSGTVLSQPERSKRLSFRVLFAQALSCMWALPTESCTVSTTVRKQRFLVSGHSVCCNCLFCVIAFGCENRFVRTIVSSSLHFFQLNSSGFQSCFHCFWSPRPWRPVRTSIFAWASQDTSIPTHFNDQDSALFSLPFLSFLFLPKEELILHSWSFSADPIFF